MQDPCAPQTHRDARTNPPGYVMPQLTQVAVYSFVRSSRSKYFTPVKQQILLNIQTHSAIGNSGIAAAWTRLWISYTSNIPRLPRSTHHAPGLFPPLELADVRMLSKRGVGPLERRLKLQKKCKTVHERCVSAERHWPNESTLRSTQANGQVSSL